MTLSSVAVNIGWAIPAFLIVMSLIVFFGVMVGIGLYCRHIYKYIFRSKKYQVK